MSKSMHPEEPRGFFTVMLWKPSRHQNVGALLRSAVVLGARGVIVAGARYHRNAADTVAAENKIPIYSIEATWEALEPFTAGGVLVAAELDERAKPLTHYCHPVVAHYLFGPEDGSVPPELLERCHEIIQAPGHSCLNLATSAALVMYDRAAKRARLYKRDRIREIAGPLTA